MSNYMLAKGGEIRFDESRWVGMKSTMSSMYALDWGGRDGQYIMDIGCGPRSMCQWYDGANVVAIDPLNDQYRNKFGGMGSNIVQLSCPAEVLLADFVNKIDFAWCYNTLRYVYDWRLVIKNIVRYLRVGGEFFLCCNFEVVDGCGVADSKELLGEISNHKLKITFLSTRESSPRDQFNLRRDMAIKGRKFV